MTIPFCAHRASQAYDDTWREHRRELNVDAENVCAIVARSPSLVLPSESENELGASAIPVEVLGSSLDPQLDYDPYVDPEHEIDFDRSQEELGCIFGAHSPASSVNNLKVGHDGVPCDHYAN